MYTHMCRQAVMYSAHNDKSGEKHTMTERLRFVDGLRGIAALLVMLYHYVGRVDLPSLHVLKLGYLGVGIFFVLSGFVITMTVSGHNLTFGFLGRFAARRAIRLDIPYWGSIAIIVLIAAFGAKYGAKAPMPTLDQLGAHMIYAQDFLGYGAISAVYWSLCFEVQFYLFLVLLLMALRLLFGAATSTAGLLVFCGLIVLSLLERHVWHASPAGLASVFWFCFGLGSVTYWVVAGKAKPAYLYGCLAAVLGAAIASNDSFAYAAAATAVALYGAHRLGTMQTWLSDSVSQFFGRTSYSMYILHSIFGWYALSIAQKFVNDWIALVAGITVAVVSAWIGYELVERPSIKLSRKVSLTPSLIAAPIRAT
jgi:peptidoglycan/LPS O-acetylase OafA/YrhL